MTGVEELIRRTQAGDTQAREQVVLENTGLIWSVAKRFIGRGAEADDLYQLGCVGFLKAVDGFDLSYGTQFSTYAVPKIAGEIRRFLRDDGAVKVSRGIKEQAATIKNARCVLTQKLNREPQLSEIAEYTGFTLDEIVLAESATASVGSIYQESGEEGFNLECVLSDTQTEDKLVENISLRQAVEKLPEKEAMVIHLRYFHALTQMRIAQILKVSQVQVSRIEKRALEHLRSMLQ